MQNRLLEKCDEVHKRHLLVVKSRDDIVLYSDYTLTSCNWPQARHSRTQRATGQQHADYSQHTCTSELRTVPRLVLDRRHQGLFV